MSPCAAWQEWQVRDRLRVVKHLRGLLADRSLELAKSLPRDPAETLVAEVLPLAEACRFLEREAEGLLAPRRLKRGRPTWLSGTSLEIHREPLGTVLVIGPANYPLFLPAVHAIQALVAGNRVLLKPGMGGSLPMQLLMEFLRLAGLPKTAMTLLSEDTQEVQDAIANGVDKVILTGSNPTGRAVMRSLAEQVTPSVMELSGCDSVYVLEDADLDLVVAAVRFGLTFNDGNTCIAPKRIYVARQRAAQLSERVFKLRIPIIPVDSVEEAIQRSQECGYGLGASIFGSPGRAIKLAARVRAGVVVVNDMIVPTADPRVPFGGRGKSGFGVTRGAEGLLEMTAVKAICVRSGKWRPHFDAPHPSDADLFQGVLAMIHSGSWRSRLGGIVQISRAAMARRKAA